MQMHIIQQIIILFATIFILCCLSAELKLIEEKKPLRLAEAFAYILKFKIMQ